MHIYKHALLLIQNETDGQLMLAHAERLAKEMGTCITLGHISEDYRELDYTSDALTKDRQSHEVIEAKAMLSRLAGSATFGVKVKSIVSIHRFKDVQTVIDSEGIDLVMLGHENRFLGVYTSFSFEFINRLTVDVLIVHVPPEPIISSP
ncbi:universal stress protein [Serratia sp. NPDC087055]|uniref:universal stress protein n=1 Tax=Serratia sp. NPDC087055 TaxID=3364516 RepID=UPI00384B6BD2